MPPSPSVSSSDVRSLPIRRSARACDYCRKAKARCDGPESWPCRRCRESGIECYFEVIPLGAPKAGRPRKDSHARHTSNDRPNFRIDIPSGSSSMVQAASPTVLERRLQRMEMELIAIKRNAEAHSARLAMLELPDGRIVGNGHHAVRPQLSPLVASDSEEVLLSLDDPQIDALAREAFAMWWTSFAAWAPYISPVTDTYEQLKSRSSLLLYCVLSVTTRFFDNPQFSSHCENQALSQMRATLYNPEPPTLDDLKGTLVYNAWLSRGAPPGHSLSLAALLELPRSLEKLLASMAEGDSVHSEARFAELMPLIRAWLSLYSQDIWLSVATGRRSMVTIDFSINSARALLKWPSLRPVDVRIIAQSELVTVLGGVQDSFLKTQKHSIDETVQIVRAADRTLDSWIEQWSEWARSQDVSTSSYMSASFNMQLYVGRFYINTLGLRDITTKEDVTPAQRPVVDASVASALQIQSVAVVYGFDRLSHATEFTLISISSAALFLLKMIKLFPEAIPDVTGALTAVRTASQLLSGAPRKQYHLAVIGALSHLEGQLAAELSAKVKSKTSNSLTMKTDMSAVADLADSSLSSFNANVLFDPEMELAISSVISDPTFWSWGQSGPADSFTGILS